MKEFGRIDILLNNAAIYSTLTLKPFEQLTVADWRKILDVNVIGQFLCCKAVLPHFKKQQAGTHHQHFLRRRLQGQSGNVALRRHQRRHRLHDAHACH